MRIFYLLLFIFCFSETIQAQVPANAIAPEDEEFNVLYANRSIPNVTGKLLNLSAEELKQLTITYTLVTHFAQTQVKKTLMPKPDGSFKLELDYALAYQQIWFDIPDLFYAGLYANKDLYLELDMKKLKAAKGVDFNGDGVRYLGTDGSLNIYMNNYVLYKRPEQLKLSDNINALVSSARNATYSIIPEYNKLYDSIIAIEDSYIAGNPSPYGWILKNERLSAYYGELCYTYWGKKMDDSLWQVMKRHKSYLTSNSSCVQFYSYLTQYIGALPDTWIPPSWKDVAVEPDLNAAEKAIIDSLINSEKVQLAYPYSAENKEKWMVQLQPRIQKIAAMRVLDKSIRRIDSMFSPAKADFLKLRLNNSTDVNTQKLLLEHILRSMHTSWCIEVEKKECKRTLDKVKEINRTLARSVGGKAHNVFGKPLIETSFGATMYKASGIKATDFVTKLKQSYPGKAIVIDRWATWCAPCLGQMPHSKKLQEASKDLPVIFVYLCTINGSTEDKWKSKVMELNQPGLHFLIDGTLDAELSGYFSFSGYPSYAFIDKAGIYKPGTIKWMSDIKDREALAALINQ